MDMSIGSVDDAHPAPNQGQSEEISYPSARAGARLLAGAIDLLIVLLAATRFARPFPPAYVIALFVVYHGVPTWLFGRTLGKALIGLRVARLGRKRSAWWSFARSGPGYLLLGFGGLSLAFVALGRSKRTPYDMLLSGAVLQETDISLRPSGLLDRVADYVEEHKRVVGERKKGVVGLIGVLWAWLSGITDRLQKGLNKMRRSTDPKAPSIMEEMSDSMALAASAAVLIATGAVISVVPQSQGLYDWLVTDRYWVGDVAPSEVSSQGPLADAKPDASKDSTVDCVNSATVESDTRKSAGRYAEADDPIAEEVFDRIRLTRECDSDLEVDCKVVANEIVTARENAGHYDDAGMFAGGSKVVDLGLVESECIVEFDY